MTMAVWRGYCGTGGKPAGNREDKLDPNQPEKSIYSTLRRKTSILRLLVIPAQAGIQLRRRWLRSLDSGLRRNDGES